MSRSHSGTRSGYHAWERLLNKIDKLAKNTQKDMKNTEMEAMYYREYVADYGEKNAKDEAKEKYETYYKGLGVTPTKLRTRQNLREMALDFLQKKTGTEKQERGKSVEPVEQQKAVVSKRGKSEPAMREKDIDEPLPQLPPPMQSPIPQAPQRKKLDYDDVSDEEKKPKEPKEKKPKEAKEKKPKEPKDPNVKEIKTRNIEKFTQKKVQGFQKATELEEKDQPIRMAKILPKPGEPDFYEEGPKKIDLKIPTRKTVEKQEQNKVDTSNVFIDNNKAKIDKAVEKDSGSEKRALLRGNQPIKFNHDTNKVRNLLKSWI